MREPETRRRVRALNNTGLTEDIERKKKNRLCVNEKLERTHARFARLETRSDPRGVDRKKALHVDMMVVKEAGAARTLVQ